MTAVPQITWSATGVAPILPAESDILAGVLIDLDNAFGGGMNTGKTTPQGQIAQSQTAIIGDKNNQIAQIVSNIDPDYADGIWQDAIGKIYFLTREPAIATLAQCYCMGLPGTVIPVNARVQDSSGNIYLCTTAGTIPDIGHIVLPFANQETGPIPCVAGSITTIYQAITGWDTVSNAANLIPPNLQAVVLGQDVESRSDFEYRRQQSIAVNGNGSIQSIYGAVFAATGVLDVYVTENVLDITQTVGATNYPLLPHSLYVAAVGGASADIANAIWSKKNDGSNMNGNTTVVISDTNYSLPYPTYNILYNAPTSTPVWFEVQIANVSGLPPDLDAQVLSAITTAFNGQGSAPRARIGSTIYASSYYAGIAAIGSAVSIISVLIGLGSATGNTVVMGIDQVPAIGNVSVILV